MSTASSTGISRRKVRPRVNIKPQRAQEYSNGYSASGQGANGNGQMKLEQMDPENTNRTTAIENIENSLHDISWIFKKFGTIVAQHEVLVERIDRNAEDALYDIEGAKKELREVYENTSTNRKLMLKIFFILICFCTFYILFVL